MTRFERILPFFTYGWATAILVVSVMPAEDLPALHIWEPDKVMHAAVYGLLTWLVWLMLQHRHRNRRPLKNVMYAVALCIAYGFCIEWIQKMLPTRLFDLYDALANTIGCALAAVLVLVFSGRDQRAQD